MSRQFAQAAPKNRSVAGTTHRLGPRVLSAGSFAAGARWLALQLRQRLLLALGIRPAALVAAAAPNLFLILTLCTYVKSWLMLLPSYLQGLLQLHHQHLQAQLFFLFLNCWSLLILKSVKCYLPQPLNTMM